MALASILLLLRRSHGHLLQRPLFHLPASYPHHFPLFSSFSTSPNSLPFSPIGTPHDDLSDSEPEPDASDLRSFIQLLSSAKSLSASPKQAVSMLSSASAVERSKGLVCRAMREVREDWELALFAFRWGEGCLTDCPWAWHFIIQVVCRKGRFDLAWVLVRRMHRNGILTQRALGIVMEGYASANQAGKAIKTFHVMERFKLSADMETFQSLLRALCRHKNIEEAEEFLLTNRKMFPLSSENFNVILDGWCNVMPDVVEAKRVWREMSNYCVRPDGTSYSHMIKCFAKVGNLFDSLRLYDEMKKRGWTPTLAVYNSLIHVLTKENCLEQAENIFERIREVGLVPNVETYNSMICPLCEGRKFEEAQALIEEMTVKGIKPNYESFHPLINQDDAKQVLKILSKMKEYGCGPNGSTFLHLLEKYFSSNESGNAMKIWCEMKKYQIEPNRSHYLVLIQGLLKSGWVPKALEYHDEMIEKGYMPDLRLDKMLKTFLLHNNKELQQRVDGNFDFFAKG